MPRGSGRVGAADVRRVRRLLVADQPVSGDDLDLAEALVHRSRRFAERLWLWVLFELFWIWILIRDVLNWQRWRTVTLALRRCSGSRHRRLAVAGMARIPRTPVGRTAFILSLCTTPHSQAPRRRAVRVLFVAVNHGHDGAPAAPRFRPRAPPCVAFPSDNAGFDSRRPLHPRPGRSAWMCSKRWAERGTDACTRQDGGRGASRDHRPCMWQPRPSPCLSASGWLRSPQF
jgi:hypothetical protein